MSLADPRVYAGTNIRRGRNRMCWRQYERLPAIVRRVLQESPVDLGTDRVTRELAGRVAPADVARREWAYAWALIRADCAEVYGPHHPQAQPPDRRRTAK